MLKNMSWASWFQSCNLSVSDRILFSYLFYIRLIPSMQRVTFFILVSSCMIAHGQHEAGSVDFIYQDANAQISNFNIVSHLRYSNLSNAPYESIHLSNTRNGHVRTSWRSWKRSIHGPQSRTTTAWTHNHTARNSTLGSGHLRHNYPQSNDQWNFGHVLRFLFNVQFWILVTLSKFFFSRETRAYGGNGWPRN